MCSSLSLFVSLLFFCGFCVAQNLPPNNCPYYTQSGYITSDCADETKAYPVGTTCSSTCATAGGFAGTVRGNVTCDNDADGNSGWTGSWSGCQVDPPIYVYIVLGDVASLATEAQDRVQAGLQTSFGLVGVGVAQVRYLATVRLGEYRNSSNPSQTLYRVSVPLQILNSVYQRRPGQIALAEIQPTQLRQMILESLVSVNGIPGLIRTSQQAPSPDSPDDTPLAKSVAGVPVVTIAAATAAGVLSLIIIIIAACYLHRRARQRRATNADHAKSEIGFAGNVVSGGEAYMSTSSIGNFGGAGRNTLAY